MTAGIGLRRMAADLQQGEHQRGELVADRQAGESHASFLPAGASARTTASSCAVRAPDLAARRIGEEAAMSSSSSSISRDASPSSSEADDLDRLRQPVEIALSTAP